MTPSEIMAETRKFMADELVKVFEKAEPVFKSFGLDGSLIIEWEYVGTMPQNDRVFSKDICDFPTCD